MPDWLDTPGEFVSVLLIVSMSLAALSWLVRAQIRQEKEMKPNGGSTMRDAINRIESKQDRHTEVMDLRFREIHARMDDHMRDHLNGAK